MQYFADMIEDNGKSVRQNNEERKHNIPLLTLVELVCDGIENGMRLLVVEHSRDCDGSPLYSLSYDQNSVNERDSHDNDIKNLKPGTTEHSLAVVLYWKSLGSIITGYPEECLKVV